MSAPSYIRRHINNLLDGKPFSIRDFLIYGPRNTVDQVFHRLLKEGRIVRVARGVYVKDTVHLPSILEIVRVKVAAFGRSIATHGSQAGIVLTKRSGQKLVFACSGASSSFRVGNCVVRLTRTSARKMQLGDSPTGLAIRALWYLGKRACDSEIAAQTVAQLQKEERKTLRLSAALMPQWLRDCFASFSRMDCQMPDLRPVPTS
jgi:hypothetical protein